MGAFPRFVIGAVLRFWSAFLACVALGTLVFGAAVFQPARPPFEFVTIGALAAGLFTLIRQTQRAQALVLAIAFGSFHLVLGSVVSLASLLSGLSIGLGLYVVGLIEDLLARAGWRFGKFVVVGPLVGGVYLALAPLTELDGLNVFNATHVLLSRLRLGTLIGAGVACGLEIADLFVGGTESTAASRDVAPSVRDESA